MQVLAHSITYFIYVNRQLPDSVDLGTNIKTGQHRGTIGNFEGWRVTSDGKKIEGQESTPCISPQVIFDPDSPEEVISEVRVSCSSSAFHLLTSV